MPRLGWHWVLLVWGYAIVWFLITDRVKLAAYRILDPVKDQGAVGPRLPRSLAHRLTCPGKRLPRRGWPRSTPIPIPGTGVHDSGDCPYGQEIRRDGNDEPGTGGRRRCDWCARHPVRA